MKRTAFYDMHVALGAKIVEFGGFEMPVQYSGIIDEHLAVRRSVGVFDVSHMGEFEVSGSGALEFLQAVTVNDVTRLAEGKAQYSAMCYPEGGIVDDLLVYHCGDHYMLVVNASNIDKDLEWLHAHCPENALLKNVSEDYSLLAVQGPNAPATLQPLTTTDLASIPYYSFARGTIAGVPVLISRTGYTGEVGFELYFTSDAAAGRRVWNAIFESGRACGIVPVGLGARDTLRLEMGYCLYGNDIDRTTNPLEAGLGWITKLQKGDFVGRDSMIRQKEGGLQRRLVGFTLADRNLARHGYEIRSGETTVGHVTSGTFSPSIQKGIGMGYVTRAVADPGKILSVAVRSKEVPATVVKLPFIQRPAGVA